MSNEQFRLYMDLGQEYEKKYDFDNALRYYLEARNTRPSIPPSYAHIATIYVKMNKLDDASEMQEGFKRVDARFDALEKRVDRIEKTALKIEHDHGQKLQALFNGYKQHTDQLDRIEKEVYRHDEFILRRIK